MLRINSFIAATLLISTAWLPSDCLAQDSPAVAGQLLTTLFSPVVAAEQNPKGILQRPSLLDRIARSKDLELAIVIDGTESMSAQLEAIQQHLQRMIADLNSALGDRLAIQIVVYRDIGANEMIEYPLATPDKAFTADSGIISAGLTKLVPKSGAPYFLEPVDVGLNAALTQLPWSDKSTVARWILLIGDAPPFEPSLQEDENGASRKYANEQLILLAKEKGITIHSLICPTRAVDQSIYDQVLPQTREFFQSLSESTGGTAFDLSNTDFRAQIASAADRAAVDYVPIGTISQREIDELASSIPKLEEAKTNRPLRIAVLPFMPRQSDQLLKMNLYDAGRNESVVLAKLLSNQLSEIGALKVDLNQLISITFDLVGLRLRNESLVKSIGDQTQADYLFCVNIGPGDGSKTKYEFALMETSSGRYIVLPRSQQLESGMLNTKVGEYLLKLVHIETRKLTPPSDLRALISKVIPALARTRNVNVAGTKEVETLIVKAWLDIEAVVGFELVSNHASNQKELEIALDAAEEKIIKALQIDNTNATACLIAANIRMARILLDRTSEKSEKWSDEAKAYLETAYQFAVKDPVAVRAEIDGDLKLFQADFEAAVDRYNEVLKDSQDEAQKLRARWMLMGLHSGDWGAKSASNVVDANKARKYAIEILAFHPNTPHARRLSQLIGLSSHNPIALSPSLPVTSKRGFKN